MDFRQYKLVAEKPEDEEVEFSGEILCESKREGKFSVLVRDVRDGDFEEIEVEKDPKWKGGGGGKRKYKVLRSIGRRYEAEQLLRLSNMAKGSKYIPFANGQNEYHQVPKRRSTNGS